MKTRVALAEEARAHEIMQRRHGSILWTRPRDGRWYRLECYDDLIGTGILRLQWGGPVKRKGNTRVIFIDALDDKETVRLVHQICLRRRAHGYAYTERSNQDADG